MADAAPAQTYATHRRLLLPYHLVVQPILMLNVIFCGYFIYAQPDLASIWHLIAGIGLFMLGLLARQMVMTVQDRLICLEMRLRLAEFLPADLKPQIGELSRNQIIGLRFASDAELPELVRRCLVGELKNGEAVKKEIRIWVSDTFRA